MRTRSLINTRARTTLGGGGMHTMSDERKTMTTDAGRPVGDNQNSLTVGPHGPVVFEDVLLFEKMAHFNRERIPERVVHAKGSGAYGSFVCTNENMLEYSIARLFSTVG